MGRVTTIASARARTADTDAEAAARLALLERMSECDEPAMCARAAVEWLHSKWSLVVGTALDGPGLVTLASLGCEVPAPGEVLEDGEVKDHPLARALQAPRPIELPASSLGPAYAELPALVGIPLVGDPLSPSEGGEAAGLLLLPGSADLTPRVAWLIRHLGRRLGQIRARRRIVASERTLARERGRVFTIINAVADPLLLTDFEGRLILANTRAEYFFTSGAEESEGRKRAVAMNVLLFSAALARQPPSSGLARRELMLVDPNDGSDRLFELIASETADVVAGGNVVSVLRSLTELQRATEEIERNYRAIRVAEAKVRAERDRLDLIINSVADPILVTEPAGAIVMMNERAERLFVAGPEASRERVRRVRTNDANFSSFVANLFANAGLRWKGDLALVEPATGEAMPVEAIAGKILGEEGSVTHVVTILHDQREALENARLYAKLKEASAELEVKVESATQELVQQNELLRRQAIQLEQASQLKSQFLANMSHEFRTPLNAILGYTSMLLEGMGGDLNGLQKKRLARVDSNGRHLLAIINDILDISRIEAGKMPLHPSTFASPDLVGEVVAEVEPLIQARPKVRVITKIAVRVPPVASDRAKVKQIVLNLLSNALKFTPEGNVSVDVAFDPKTRRVRVAVKDTGVGIDPKDHALVFEDFRQVDDSPRRQHGGTGLGLAICQRLASMLGGGITLDSRLGEGATFALTIPLRLPG
jgi:signal transduction histidine kinase